MSIEYVRHSDSRETRANHEAGQKDIGYHGGDAGPRTGRKSSGSKANRSTACHSSRTQSANLERRFKNFTSASPPAPGFNFIEMALPLFRSPGPGRSASRSPRMTRSRNSGGSAGAAGNLTGHCRGWFTERSGPLERPGTQCGFVGSQPKVVKVRRQGKPDSNTASAGVENRLLYQLSYTPSGTRMVARQGHIESSLIKIHVGRTRATAQSSGNPADFAAVTGYCPPTRPVQNFRTFYRSNFKTHVKYD